MAREAGAHLVSRRSLVAGAMLLPFLLSGCGIRPDPAAASEAEADRESALSLARSYLQVKYGERHYDADILSSEPYYFFGGKGDGVAHYDGRWTFQATVRGRSCTVGGSTRTRRWADDFQRNELEDALSKRLGSVLDFSSLGEAVVLAGSSGMFTRCPRMLNGLFDGENPFCPSKGSIFNLMARIACYDDASADEAMMAIETHFADGVVQGADLRVDVGVFPGGKFDTAQGRLIRTCEIRYDERKSPYRASPIVPGEA